MEARYGPIRQCSINIILIKVRTNLKWRALGNTMPPYRGKQSDGRHDGIKSGRNGGGRKAPTTTTTRKKYTAHTTNHHDVLFTSGNTNKDAAKFTDTVRVLARHVSTLSTYKHGPTLAKRWWTS